MATYYLKGTDSDLTGGADFSKELSAVAETAGSITVSVANSSTETSYGFTKPHKPSNADWETGTITVKVNVTTAVTNMFLSIQVDRINSAGTVQESSTVATEQQINTTGVKTFTVSSVNWTAGNCDDRLRVRYIFRSAQSHGTALRVVIATGTTDGEVTPSGLTEHAGTCYGTFVKTLDQYDTDHLTKIATGGSTGGDGVSTNIYLDALIASWDTADKLTLKTEVETTATSFDNVANKTAALDVSVDPDSPYVRRSHRTVYDPTRKRMILFGGYDGTNNYNDVWELTLDNLASPQPQWRKLAPTGTPPTARRTHIAFFDETNNRMIVGFGWTTTDNNDMYSLSFASSRDGAWTTLSPTGTIPTARSQASVAVDQTNKKAYLCFGWGAARYNDIQEFDFSTTNGAWTQKSADGAGGAASKRNDPAVVWDSTASRLVIFGGYDGTNRLADTWTYVPSTNTWADKTSVFGGTAPSTRELMFSAIDTTNNRMVIWGGRNGTAAGDVRLDMAYLTLAAGSETWNVVSGTAGERPYGSWTNAGCYDPNHKLFICFGGFDSSLENQRNILAIDCSSSSTLTMKEVVVNQYLRGRDAMAYAYNPDLNETLITGGYARVIGASLPFPTDLINGNHTNEMWIYNHTNGDWKPALRGEAAIKMTNREGSVAVYDTNRNRFIIFGGLTGNNTSNNTYYNDVWELKADANNQYQLTKLAPTGTKPSARWLSAAVYDEVNDRMVLFGGDDGTFLNDLYSLSFSGGADGAWSTITATGTAHPAVRQAAYAYDSTNNRMYLFCGGTGVNSFTNQVNYLSLGSGTEAWTSRATSPTARRGMTAVYDAGKGKVICFGGYNGTNVLNDLYTYSVSGNTWATLTPATNPEARRSHAVGADTTNDKMIIFGGRDSADAALSFNSRNNTWELDYSNATESNWAWTKKDPKIYLNGSVAVTSLSASTNYHWQAWVTGTSGLDSQKSSYGGNAESATDFGTAAGATPVTITKSLKYTVKTTPTALTKSLKYTVKTTPTALTKSLQYAVRKALTVTKSLQYAVESTPTAVTKSLKYTVKTTPSALTKSLAYSVRTTASVTKSLQYAVKAPASVTKSLKYTVLTTPTALTKSLRYAIKTPPAITKSLQYAIKAPVTAITKSLKYTVKTTPSAVTKSLAYDVRTTPSAVTKSLKYAVKTTPSALTKSLQYAVKPSPAITKSLQYAVKSPVTVTKSLTYRVRFQTVTITKSLQYAVRTAQTITKGLTYDVRTSVSAITKSLRYAIRTTPSVTKSLQYAVKAPASLTKSLKYTVITTPSALTKSLTYDVKPTFSITKSLKYTVIKSPSVTKSLQYAVKTNPSVTKSLQYVVQSSVSTFSITKSLKYTVKTAQSVTKSLTYDVKSPFSVTKSLKYTVKTTPSALTKSLTYAVRISQSAITKSLQYAVRTASTVTKSLQYSVRPSIAITKSLQYTVKAPVTVQKSLKYTIFTNPSAITKALTYRVRTVATITKTLAYDVRTASAITKSLAYRVKAPVTVTKSLKYTVLPAPTTIQKSLAYYVRTSPTITKSAQYAVKKAITITKGLIYDVKAAVSITKSLKYTVKTTPAVIQKQLQYNITGGAQVITKDLRYAVKKANSVTKSLTYDVKSPVSVTKSLKYTVKSPVTLQKSLKYTVLTIPSALTKSLRYAVRTVSALTKSLAYAVRPTSSITKTLTYKVKAPVTVQKTLTYTVVAPASAITKSLKYTVKTTPSALTKSLQYAIEKAIAITKSARYAVKTSQTITKGLTYDVRTAPSAITKALTYRVRTASTITKSLSYEVKSAVAITKSLKYTVKTTPSALTKALRYAVRVTSALTKSLTYKVKASVAVQKTLQYNIATQTFSVTKSLTYAVKTSASVTKSLTYAIESTPSAITKSLTYRVRATPSAVQKTLTYAVKSPVAITKTLRYAVEAPASAITKTLTYRVAVSTSVTKSLSYGVVVARSVTKGLVYKVKAPVGITKSMAYRMTNEPVFTRRNDYFEHTPKRFSRKNDYSPL